jgi:hypothetical protein
MKLPQAREYLVISFTRRLSLIRAGFISYETYTLDY